MKFRDLIGARSVILLLLSLTFVAGCSEEKDSGKEEKPAAAEPKTETVCTAGTIAVMHLQLSPADTGGTSGAYCTIKNQGTEADTLLEILSPIAGEVQIHQMVDEGGMMVMRRAEGPIVIRGGDSIEMKAGGWHIMLMKLRQPLANGDKGEIEFHFARGGTLKCEAGVGNSSGKGGAQTAAADDKGGTIYQRYCQTCHQEGGKGIKGIFPPLAGSDFLKDKNRAIDAVVNGKSGPITVNGAEYDGTMPPLLSVYDDEQAAAVINYVMKNFGDGSWSTTAGEVGKIRKK